MSSHAGLQIIIRRLVSEGKADGTIQSAPLWASALDPADGITSEWIIATVQQCQREAVELEALRTRPEEIPE